MDVHERTEYRLILNLSFCSRSRLGIDVDQQNTMESPKTGLEF